MKTIKWLVCKVFGHKYKTLIKLTPGTRKVGCSRCNCQWGMHDATKSLVSWDSDLEELYKAFGVLK